MDLNGEWVEFQVTISGSLLGYAVKNSSDTRYGLPDSVFEAGQILTLHSGWGVDSQTDLYWNAGTEGRNNDGDGVIVLESQGHFLLNYTWPAPWM